MSFPPREFSPKVRAKVVALYRGPHTQESVAAQLGLSWYHVNRILAEELSADERVKIAKRHKDKPSRARPRSKVNEVMKQTLARRWVE